MKGIPPMFVSLHLRQAVITAAMVATFTSLAINAQTSFPTAVESTQPLAFYRLDSTSGKSLAGATTYKAVGSAGIAASGAPVPTANSRFLKLDGRTASITTTQVGGVGTAASIMVWVNLAELPSKTDRIFYVAGECEVGNDLDLQFLGDNNVGFFTAAGSNIQFKPPVDSLIGKWHQIAATLDTQSQKRVLYWDGKLVATDKGGGHPGKKTAFTIGACTCFSGRFFSGSIDNVGLWNRVLKPEEVAAIYAAAGTPASVSAASPAPPSATPIASGPTPTTGPFASKANVDVEDAAGGKVQLKREEAIAYMFLSSIEVIEHNCQLTLQKVCPLNQILTASYPPAGKNIEHLKFDPNKTDPNYTYTLATGGMAWEAHANPKKPGLKGWCFMARDVGTTIVTYNKTGPSGYTDIPIGNRGMSGDSFAVQ
ncbi:MAG: LamG domain-containing protein [Terracidiphilus sp.]